MSVAPSFQDLVSQGQAEAQSRRPDLLFADGDVSLAILHGNAAMADAVIRLEAQNFRNTFIDGAEGDALTALVDDHLNIQRQAATAAQVTLTFTRPSAGGSEAAGTIPSGTTVATAFDSNGNQVQFTTDSNLAFGLADLGPHTVAATCTVTGRDGNVIAAAINRVVDQPTFDGTFHVTNAAAAGGGNIEESDEDLRTRARSYYLTLRRGTLAAIEYGAKQVDTVRVASANEDTDTFSVTLLVADSDGNSTAEMIEDVIVELENWRCAGIDVTVSGGTQILMDIAVELTVRSGFDVAAFSDLISDAMIARIAKLGAGETMYLDSLVAAIIAVAPDDILDVDFTTITATPGGAQALTDLAATAAQVVRGGTMTISEAA